MTGVQNPDSKFENKSLLNLKNKKLKIKLGMKKEDIYEQLIMLKI